MGARSLFRPGSDAIECDLRLPYVHLAALLLLMLCAAGIRSLTLGESLWLDELHTSWVTTDSLSDIGPRARLGNQQATYFYLPWLSAQVFGEFEWALRLPSFLAGVALIPCLFWLALRWTRSLTAAWTAAILATLDPRWIFYAQEARVYALIQLLAICQFALFASLLKRPTVRTRLAHMACCVLLFYLHYTTALLVAAEVVAWLVSGFRGGKRSYPWQQAGIDLGGYLILIAPTLTHVWHVAGRRSNWEAFVPRPGWHEVRNLVWFDVYLLAPLAAAGGAWLLARWLNRGRYEFAQEPLPAARVPRIEYCLLSGCWLMVPLVIAWLASVSDLARLFFPRYLVGSSVAAVLIAAWCVASARAGWLRAVVAAAVIFAGLWQWGWLHEATYTRALWTHAGEDWRGAIAAIDTQDPTGELPILIDAGLIESQEYLASDDPQQHEYLSFPLRGMYRPQSERTKIVPFAKRLGFEGNQAERSIEPLEPIWILMRGSGEPRGLTVKRRQTFGNVTLLKAERRKLRETSSP